MTTGRVSGKTALVTGAASGIGYGIAETLVREGATVALSDVNIPAGQAAAQAIGNGAFFLAHDVRDELAWRRVMAEVESKMGRLDVLVNNAGTPGDVKTPSDPENTTIEEWRWVNAVNVEGVFLGCKHAIPLMQRSGGGSIVNISSIGAETGTPFLTAYGASKAAVTQLTMSVALYCAAKKYGIRCNAIHPGQTITPAARLLWEDVARNSHGLTVDQVREQFEALIPLGQLGETNDIAFAVLYLASEESKQMTGAHFPVDGGQMARP